MLLGIADFANDEGIAYPSIPTLAKKARLTTRNTQRAIRRLMTAKELLIEDGKGPHRVHLYRIILPESSTLEGRQYVGVTKSQDDNLDIGRVTSQPHKPSEETVIKKEILGDDKKSPSLTVEDIRTRWNSIPGVKTCRALGVTIRDRIQTRIREHPDVPWWNGLFQQILGSDFLCGRSKGKNGAFHAPLDWALSPKNLDKILAGNYDSLTSNGQGPSLTCTKRVQSPGERFLHPCGQPANPTSRPTEPRCSEHLREASTPKELSLAAH